MTTQYVNELKSYEFHVYSQYIRSTITSQLSELQNLAVLTNYTHSAMCHLMAVKATKSHVHSYVSLLKVTVKLLSKNSEWCHEKHFPKFACLL